jgi:hypothetical protein
MTVTLFYLKIAVLFLNFHFALSIAIAAALCAPCYLCPGVKLATTDTNPVTISFSSRHSIL